MYQHLSSTLTHLTPVEIPVVLGEFCAIYIGCGSVQRSVRFQSEICVRPRVPLLAVNGLSLDVWKLTLRLSITLVKLLHMLRPLY